MCQPQIAIFSSIKSDILKNIHRVKIFMKVVTEHFFTESIKNMVILHKVVFETKSSVAIRETSHNDLGILKA